MYVRIPDARKQNGLAGFGTTIKRVINGAKAAAPVAVAPVNPATVQYTTTSGWAKRPIVTQGNIVSTGNIVGSGPKYTPVIDPALLNRGVMLPEILNNLSREELTRLRDQELILQQEKESGGGVSTELEAKAAQNDAVSRAVESGGGSTIVSTTTQKAGKDYLPLILAAAMAYFLA